MSGRRLFVIGQREVAGLRSFSEHEFSVIGRLANHASHGSSHDLKIESCCAPQSLVTACAGFSRIDVLEIYYHGAPGVMHLGAGKDGPPIPLFDCRGGSLVTAVDIGALAQHLELNCEVRLLGCRTARHEVGRRLLERLQGAFDQAKKGIVVKGTTTAVKLEHFDLMRTGLFNTKEILVAAGAHVSDEFRFPRLGADDHRVWMQRNPSP